MIELRELWIFSKYDTFVHLLSDFQEATMKDILFMDDNEFLEAIKKYIEESRGIKYEDYEDLV